MLMIHTFLCLHGQSNGYFKLLLFAIHKFPHWSEYSIKQVFWIIYYKICNKKINIVTYNMLIHVLSTWKKKKKKINTIVREKFTEVGVWLIGYWKFFIHFYNDLEMLSTQLDEDQGTDWTDSTWHSVPFCKKYRSLLCQCLINILRHKALVFSQVLFAKLIPHLLLITWTSAGLEITAHLTARDAWSSYFSGRQR